MGTLEIFMSREYFLWNLSVGNIFWWVVGGGGGVDVRFLTFAGEGGLPKSNKCEQEWRRGGGGYKF